jgi:hypothetical protein
MARCFVIQPFDSGPFDERYEDVFDPAIREAGLEPYRVDRDPHSVVLIESIERGIRESTACLADISTNNPNVWFEVGYAIASGKPIVLVCGPRSEPFPFDVNQRPIIRYETQAPRDFAELRTDVTKRLKAQVERQQQMQDIADVSPLQDSEGLSPHEMVALVCLAESVEGPASVLSGAYIHREMENAGFTNVATNISLTTLMRKGLVEQAIGYSDDGDQWQGYRLTDQGVDWLITNQSLVALKRERARPKAQPRLQPQPDDDIPF